MACTSSGIACASGARGELEEVEEGAFDCEEEREREGGREGEKRERENTH